MFILGDRIAIHESIFPVSPVGAMPLSAHISVILPFCSSTSHSNSFSSSFYVALSWKPHLSSPSLPLSFSLSLDLSLPFSLSLTLCLTLYCLHAVCVCQFVHVLLALCSCVLTPNGFLKCVDTDNSHLIFLSRFTYLFISDFTYTLADLL